MIRRGLTGNLRKRVWVWGGMAGEEQFYYYVQEFIWIFFVRMGFKKIITGFS